MCGAGPLFMIVVIRFVCCGCYFVDVMLVCMCVVCVVVLLVSGFAALTSDWFGAFFCECVACVYVCVLSCGVELLMYVLLGLT